MDERTRESSPQLADTPTVDDEVKTPETEELKRDIAETRAELGDTVEALAEKTDVKAQAKSKVAEKQAEVKAKVDEVRHKVSDATPEQARAKATDLTGRARERPLPAAAVGAFFAGMATGWLLSRR